MPLVQGIQSETIREKFERQKVCVIIPTYNNSATLSEVIADVCRYAPHVIVINDGSTDATEQIVRSFPYVTYLGYKQNTGKGWALRKAFKYATDQGFNYAITMDSDGQHFAKDLKSFTDKLEHAPGSIIIGSRNMDQDSVPGKSSFGHKFSNFWFKIETGIDCPDTQSGFRLYPLLPLKDLKFVTRKYEFEIEVLVRAAWKGIEIESVPVTVYYAPKATRISHFRPFKDFTRISILNTVLVIITFLYIKPRNLVNNIFKKKRLRSLISEQLFNPNQSDGLKSCSIAFGVFMGIIPVWGFQLALAIFLAVLFRLNKTLVIIAANISIPPMIPFIIFLSCKMGSLWTGNYSNDLVFSQNLSIETIQSGFHQYITGSIILAIVSAIVSGAIAFLFFKFLKRKSVVTI